MITEITDKAATRPTGWIYFDAECRFCVAHRRRWGQIFERRGFVWLPLQTPGAAKRLEITESQLREEMWLQLADGRKFSGVNAWSAQMRRVWWMWPLGVLLALPGCNAGAWALYRWIAKNRHCLGGTCTIHSHGKAAASAHRMVVIASLAVLTHIRNNNQWGHAQTPISATEVKAIREPTQSRVTQWAAAELLTVPVIG